MKQKMFLALLGPMIVTLAYGISQQQPNPVRQTASFDRGRTLYGFFPSSPEVTIQSVLDTYGALSEHADAILLQKAIPWEDFVRGTEAKGEAVTDIYNHHLIAQQNGLKVILVVDPLNPLDRREFQNLPADWEASFGNPQVRTAFTNYTLRILRDFRPRYLGLASEINTYADAHPDDFPNFLSLYESIYRQVKAEAPDTRVFVTFQWEVLNNLVGAANRGIPYTINWHQVESFEPNLDLWAISSYPFIVFKSGAEIPNDYYTPLLSRTEKPVAVAEGGYPSEPVGPFSGAPQDQLDYLHSIHTQIGGLRLAFWIYLLINDFDLDSYVKHISQIGMHGDIEMLGWFSTMGLTALDRTPKPALQYWDSLARPATRSSSQAAGAASR